MKRLKIFKTKMQVALDLCASLNPSKNDGKDGAEYLMSLAEKLCRKYSRLQLEELWLKSNRERLALCFGGKFGNMT